MSDREAREGEETDADSARQRRTADMGGGRRGREMQGSASQEERKGRDRLRDCSKRTTTITHAHNLCFRRSFARVSKLSLPCAVPSPSVLRCCSAFFLSLSLSLSIGSECASTRMHVYRHNRLPHAERKRRLCVDWTPFSRSFVRSVIATPGYSVRYACWSYE